jgi:hypothetical protein
MRSNVRRTISAAAASRRPNSATVFAARQPRRIAVSCSGAASRSKYPLMRRRTEPEPASRSATPVTAIVAVAAQRVLEERVLAPERVVEASLSDPDRVEKLGGHRGGVAALPKDVESACDRTIEVESRTAHRR